MENDYTNLAERIIRLLFCRDNNFDCKHYPSRNECEEEINEVAKMIKDEMEEEIQAEPDIPEPVIYKSDSPSKLNVKFNI